MQTCWNVFRIRWPNRYSVCLTKPRRVVSSGEQTGMRAARPSSLGRSRATRPQAPTHALADMLTGGRAAQRRTRRAAAACSRAAEFEGGAGGAGGAGPDSTHILNTHLGAMGVPIVHARRRLPEHCAAQCVGVADAHRFAFERLDSCRSHLTILGSVLSGEKSYGMLCCTRASSHGTPLLAHDVLEMSCAGLAFRPQSSHTYSITTRNRLYRQQHRRRGPES